MSRGDKILETMATRGVIKEKSVSFLKAALDPFHDHPVGSIAGWPDLASSPSVVRTVKKSMTINADAVIGSVPWQFKVTMWPLLKNYSLDLRDFQNSTMGGAIPAPGAFYGGVTVQTTPMTTPITVSTAQFGHLDASEFLDGHNRIIGVGYEISDDSADIYKQGHSFHSRIPFEKQDARYYTNASGAHMELYTTKEPPREADTMMLYPDTVAWPAREGCYAVGSMGVTNYPEMPAPVGLRVTKGDLDFDTLHQCAAPVIQTSGSGINSISDNVIADLDISTSLFSGLNAEGSFTLTVHWIIESFPTHAQPDILVLATPSADYDPIALELYEHAVQSLPVAVRIGENPNGEWWSSVISDATEFLAPMAAALGAPELAPLVYGGGKALARFVKPKQPRNQNNTRR